MSVTAAHYGELTATAMRPRLTAAYVRLTRDESLKGLSAAAQKENIADYVRRAGLPGLQVYEEPRAVGGDVPFEQRAAGRRLVDDIQAGRVGAIVVRDMDRLTRNLALWDWLRQLCWDHAVEIHTLSGPLALKSPSDKFAGRVRAAAAELEKDQVGDRVCRVKRAIAQHGRHVGGPPPFGYTSQARRRADLRAGGLGEEEASLRSQTELPQRGHLYVDEAEAKVVRLVFEWYVHKRWGCRRISNELNRRGHRRRTGLLWCTEKVRRIINDPTVAGFIPYDEHFFEAQRGRRTPKCRQSLNPGKHEPIVPEALWRRAQEIKASNVCDHLGKGKGAYVNRRYALGGVLRCSCGAPMAAKGARADKAFGYYVCCKRKYRGRDAIGGCPFPQLNTDAVHHAFWAGLSRLIASDDLVDRVHAAAVRLGEARERERAETSDSARTLQKLEADLSLWYRRHDAARSEAEQEAAWTRIVELTERVRQLRGRGIVEPAARPRLEPVTRERVARYLKSLGALVGQTEDAGKAFVRSLAEHHGLVVTALEAKRLSISLRLRPPGAEGAAETFAVLLEGDARLPSDRVTDWVEENQAKAPPCACGCGRPVQIYRRHYWKGLPEFRSECRHKGMGRKRKRIAEGYYTGEDIAKLLGIGRTTVNRWIKSGRLPKPIRSISGMLLFDRPPIDRLAAARTRQLARSG
jgi:site-specific DNA recombinase